MLSEKYPVVTEGHTIAIEYLNKVFYIDIVKTEPAPVIDILNVNLNVDFEKPLDYIEPVVNEKMEVEDIERESLEHPKPTIRENLQKNIKRPLIMICKNFQERVID